MGLRIQLLSILASVAIIFFIVSLIRKRKLREEYSIMWLVGSLALVLFSIWRELLDIMADLLGVFYAPAVLLLVMIFFGGLIFLHLTIVISRHADQQKSLAQEVALLKARMEALGLQRRAGDDPVS